MTPTLFSVSYAGLWGQHRLELEPFVHRAAALGYRAVELMGKRPHLSVLDAGPSRLDSVRRAAAEAGVEIATIAAYTNFTLGRDTEIPAVEIQVEYVRRLAEIGERLGARVVRVFTGYATELEGYSRDWQLCVQGVRECAEVCAGTA